MTREQAAAIILAAEEIPGEPPPEEIALAHRIANALAALGLLQFADVAEPEQPPVATSTTEQPTNKDPQSWATTRNRKDPVT